MPTVLAQDGQQTEIAPDELVPAWQQGRVQLVSGQRYDVQLPDGRIGTVPAESMAEALKQGAKPLVTGAAAKAREAREYGGAKGMAIAAASGAAEQATLGLVDQVLPDSWKEAIEKSQRQNPLSTMAGEGAGMAGLSALLPGAGLGGLAERGGIAALRTLGVEAGESAAARIAARAGTQALRGVAEGAQYGAARTIADNAIDPKDHPLTAASVLATIGGDALWGGALGAGFGAVHGAFSELRPRGLEPAPELPAPKDAPEPTLDTKLGDGRSPAPKDVAEVASKVAGGEPVEGLGHTVKQWYTKLASAASGASAEDIAPFLEESNRASLLEADGIRETASRDIRAHVDEILKNSRDVMKEGERGMKREHIARAVEGVDPAEAAESSRNIVDHTISRISEMLEQPDEFGGEKPLKNALKVATKAQKQIEQAITAGDVAEQYGLLDDLKKGIGKYTKGASRLNPAAATDELVSLQNKARADRLQDLYETIRGGLEDEETWGQAARNQRAVNEAWTKQIDASDRFHRALTTEIGRDELNPWLSKRGVDPAKADTYVRNLTNPSQDLTHKAVTDYVQSTRDLVNAMREQWELPPDKLAKVERLGQAADAFQSTLDRATKSLTLANQFERIREASTGHASTFLAGAGFLSHGVAGGLGGLAVGKVAGIFTRPAEAIMQLARIEGMARRSQGRVASAVRGFLRGAERTPRAVSLDSYTRKAARVQELVQQPEAVTSRVAGNLGKLGVHSPALGMTMAAMTASGLKLLHDKLPPQPPTDPLDPKAKAPTPPPAQRESWLRYHDAVVNPIGVVEDLQAGRLSLEGVEVLKSVYPPLYAHVQETVFDELSKGKGSDLDKQQRVGLALLLDLPTPDLSPQYIAERQSTYAQVAQAAQSQAQQPKKHRPINIASPRSPVDRVESGPSDKRAA